MVLKDYIRKYRRRIYLIETYVNTKDIPDFNDKNTRNLYSTDDGYVMDYVKWYKIRLSKTLLNSEPLKVYILNNEEYSLLNSQGLYYDSGIPKHKKVVIAVYPNSILDNEHVEHLKNS